MKTHSLKACLAVVALVSALLAQNAFAKPPHEPNLAQEKPQKQGFKGARHDTPMGELPHIKGISPEIFMNASENAQIKALQIEANSRESLRKATQKFKDERDKLELEKKTLQIKLYHAKAQNDEKQTSALLSQIYQNEQALTKNKFAERELRDKEEFKRVEQIYKELRGK